MDLNVTVARFLNGSHCVTTEPLWQWDKGQILVLEEIDLPFSYQVHFSNEALHGEAIPQVGSDGQVDIPNEMLTSGAPIYFWIYLNETENDGETEYWGTIPVNARSKPVDYEPTPEQEDIIGNTISALNAGVDVARGAAESASDASVAAAQSAEDATTAATAA